MGAFLIGGARNVPASVVREWLRCVAERAIAGNDAPLQADLFGQVTALAEHPCDSVSGTGGVVWRFFIGMAMAKKEWDQGTETTPDG